MAGNRVKRIIAFDSWTEGRVTYEPVAAAFHKAGYELLLIHVGSWGHDVGRPLEEMMGEMRVRDILYYGKKNALEIIQDEDPEAAVFLSTRPLAHMAFKRYCDYLDIPTCHLYHGLVTVQAVGEGETPYRLDYVGHVQKIFRQAPKNLQHIFPFYFGALIRTRAPFAHWLDFLSDLKTRIIHSLGKTRFIKGTQTDMGCVFTDADVEHMHSNYAVPYENIHVVGNPDLMRFGLNADDAGSAMQTSNADSVMYVDTALLEANVAFRTPEEFIGHIEATRAEVEKAGLRFVMKPHPAHFSNGVVEALDAAGIDLCENENFVARLKDCAAAIVEPSSAALAPAIAGVLLLTAQYDRLSDTAFGAVIKEYPLSLPLRELANLKSAMQEAENLKSQISAEAPNAFDEWIKRNIGPLPADAMPERIVNAVLDYCRKRDHSCQGNAE